MAKEYLKMADVFIGDVIAGDDDLIRDEDGLIGDMQWPSDCVKYAAHAINSHDELVAEVERLRDALHDAATSLETIHIRSFGEESMLDSKQEMRAYAGARAMVARKDLSGE